jgi:hypothetical protein
MLSISSAARIGSPIRSPSSAAPIALHWNGFSFVAANGCTPTARARHPSDSGPRPLVHPRDQSLHQLADSRVQPPFGFRPFRLTTFRPMRLFD